MVALWSMSRSGYDTAPWTIVTPGVDVVSVAEMAVSTLHPLFLTLRFTLAHSLLLITPFPFPDASSTASPIASSFDAPDMQKFWLAVPPLVGLTDAESGEALVQLRSGSVAEAV